jgi:hypothetical protein
MTYLLGSCSPAQLAVHRGTATARGPVLSLLACATSHAPRLFWSGRALFGRLGGEGQRLRYEHLMGGVECDLRRDVNACLGHPWTEAAFTEGIERFFAFPGVDVVAVATLPPCQMGDTPSGTFREPADGFTYPVVLLLRDSWQDYVSDDSHKSPPVTRHLTPSSVNSPP